ncbi:hypothetical protein CRG98_045965, partial [Punica granatum]
LAEPACSCFLPPCWVCSLLRFYFDASLVSRASWLVPLATLPGLLTRASLLSCFASLLARASCDLAESAHPCEFTFMLRKLAEPASSSLLRPYRVCSPGLVYFHASQVRRAYSLVLLATLPGLLTRASLLSCFASSPSLLGHATCNLAGSSYPCGFTFMVRKFADPSRSWFLQPCRVCFPMRIYFHASHVRRVCSHSFLATLAGLLTRASLLSFFPSSLSLLARASCELAGSAHPLLSCFASSPSLLARASCQLAGSAHQCEFTLMLRNSPSLLARATCNPVGSAHPCELTFMLRKFTSLLTRASLLSCFASSRSLLARASCHRAGSAHPCDFTLMLCKFVSLLARASCYPAWSAHPCELTLMLRKLAEPAGSSLLRPYRLAGSAHPCEFTLMLRKFAEPTRSCVLPACRVCPPLAGSAHPCEFTLMLRKFAEPTRSCVLPACRVCPPVRVYFDASQVRRAYSLLAGSAHPCEFTLMLRKFAEPTRSCVLPACRVCPPVRVYFDASQVRRAYSLLAGSAHPCEFTLMLRKFAEPTRSCVLPACRVCPPVRVYFDASQVRRACSLVLLATLPRLLTRASLLSCLASLTSLLAHSSCKLTGSAHPCEFTFILCKFAESFRSCFLRPCRDCSLVRVYFLASQVRRSCWLVPLATLP